MTQTYPEENLDLKNFAAFIETYALALTYEYRVQHTALQALQIMSTNINIKLFLLSQYDYEVCWTESILKLKPFKISITNIYILAKFQNRLLELQDRCVSSTGKLIKDECSLLRTELLQSHTHNEDYQLYTSRVKSAPKVKLSRRKLSEIEKFLQKTKHGPFDNNWLKYARKFYKMSLSSNMKVREFDQTFIVLKYTSRIYELIFHSLLIL